MILLELDSEQNFIFELNNSLTLSIYLMGLSEIVTKLIDNCFKLKINDGLFKIKTHENCVKMKICLKLESSKGNTPVYFYNWKSLKCEYNKFTS